MTPEETELLTAWKAVYGELNPLRDPDSMNYTDAMLALGVRLRREILTKKYPPANAHGLEARITAKPHGKKGARE